jgi:CrcB protein
VIAFLVALAGGLGAVTRFVVDAEVGRRAPRLGVPLGTAVINVTGSFLLALVTGWWATHTGDPGLKLALGTGFLGGYTTFSTASVEAARLFRAGEGWRLALHAGGMLVLSVAGAVAGFWLGGL